MTDHSAKIEGIPSVQRRRRWSPAENMRMVEETNQPGATYPTVHRAASGGPGALTAAAAGEEVIAVSEHRAPAAAGARVAAPVGQEGAGGREPQVTCSLTCARGDVESDAKELDLNETQRVCGRADHSRSVG